MEDIILGEARADMATLPKLKRFSLCCLPRLTRICQGKLVCNLVWDINLMFCPELKRLPFLINNESFVSATIIGSQAWWETLAWEDLLLKEHVSALFVEGFEHATRLRNAIPNESAKQMFKIARFNFQDEKDEKDLLSIGSLNLGGCFQMYSY
ncbi:uncharacterized protein LOC120270798 [Dioscorea cayenensis subsp. rotundata]|uniref:Uncharacterized protein LOC120270798 n=1 Tax=Dioscorea cayennensis subsp. rotundata TaxID=55577 RepID=A0AB40C3R3_DIOCR|nr:uncharacterized protein LOC120270798 [Dioscorea cayenensis subsp. rotundata]